MLAGITIGHGSRSAMVNLAFRCDQPSSTIPGLASREPKPRSAAAPETVSQPLRTWE